MSGVTYRLRNSLIVKTVFCFLLLVLSIIGLKAEFMMLPRENSMNIAINGFGRIGRNFLRAVLLDPNAARILKVAAINIGPARLDMVAHMFKYDTLMGTYPGQVILEGDELIIDELHIKIIAQRDPLLIDWKLYNIDWVVESSGFFTKRDQANKHIQAGAGAVLITAPAQGEDIAIVPGVNMQFFDRAKHKIVSLGSCTTNAFITLLKALNDAFEITDGLMTTVHAYTNTQVLLDVESEDLRRSRAAALNIIPTTTGVSKLVGTLIPSLAGKIQAVAIRVPVAKVSLIDFSFTAKKPLSVAAIHDACVAVAQTDMAGIVDLTFEPLVSSDFSGSNYSVVVDGQLTAVQGNMGKIFGWYDNEWGYSVRLKDFLLYAAQQ